MNRNFLSETESMEEVDVNLWNSGRVASSCRGRIVWNGVARWGNDKLFGLVSLSVV